MRQLVKNNVLMAFAVIDLAIISMLAFHFLLGLPPVFGGGLVLGTALATWIVYRLFSRGSIDWSQPLRWGRVVKSFGIALVAVGVVIQAVPFGRSHSNPPVTGEPQWDSARTRELTERACFDCHSNEATYPWYSNVAPFSWAVEWHVSRGRGKVNYSEFDRPQREADESAETVEEGSMPPFYFQLTHSAARLTDAEKQELVRGLKLTFGG